MIGLEVKRDLPLVNKTKKEISFLETFDPCMFKKAKKVFDFLMMKNNYKFPEHWGEYKLNVIDKINYNFWHIIRKIYW